MIRLLQSGTTSSESPPVATAVQLLPSSYNQRRTIDLNYEVLRSQYRERKNHKLDEWRQYCDFIRGLPYSEFITLRDTV